MASTPPTPEKDFIQLSRFLFDTAASQWWAAFSVELSASALSVLFGATDSSRSWQVCFAAIVAFLLIFAHAFRLSAEGIYDLAETMRRQAAFSEGLGWKIVAWQARRWLERAGISRLGKLGIQPRDADYYATTAGVGVQKLGEMTMESLFYTRFLYRKLFAPMLGTAAIGAALIVGLLFAATNRDVPQGWSASLAIAAFLTVPAVLGLDAVGWSLRLHRAISALDDIEQDLESALPSGSEKDMLRVVSEYNCVVVEGIPIPGFVFRRYRDEIAGLWTASR